jgi:tetratricopeptide (TPR) repeat protein
MEAIEDRARVSYLHTASAFLCLEADPPGLDEARSHLDAAETILSEFDLPAYLAYVYSERSRLEFLEGRPGEALNLAERAIDLQSSDNLEQARALFLKGRALADLDRGNESRAAFNEAAETFARLGARQQQASCLREIGELDLADGDVDSAVAFFREGLELIDPRRSRA